MATMFGDVTGLQQLHHQKSIPLSCREDQRLISLKAKSFRNIAIYQKLRGVHQAPPPRTTVGVWLCVYVWELSRGWALLARARLPWQGKLVWWKHPPPFFLFFFFFFIEFWHPIYPFSLDLTPHLQLTNIARYWQRK